MALSPWMVRFTLFPLEVPMQVESSRKVNSFSTTYVVAHTSIIWLPTCRSTVTRTSSAFPEDAYSHTKLATPWLLANTTAGWATCIPTMEKKGDSVTHAHPPSGPSKSQRRFIFDGHPPTLPFSYFLPFKQVPHSPIPFLLHSFQLSLHLSAIFQLLSIKVLSYWKIVSWRQLVVTERPLMWHTKGLTLPWNVWFVMPALWASFSLTCRKGGLDQIVSGFLQHWYSKVIIQLEKL